MNPPSIAPVLLICPAAAPQLPCPSDYNSAVKAALIPGKTQLVMIESPTNPRMQICDIAAISRAAHEAGALVIVDNSFMTPLMQRPLDLGADISMTSGTKYIGGHGDITLGMLAVKGEELAKRVYFLQNAEGAGLAPLDCWLAARGLKTMALRLERSQDNAAKLARFLAAHPLVTKLNYAGYERHPGAALHAQQANGGGAVLSFETGGLGQWALKLCCLFMTVAAGIPCHCIRPSMQAS
jgi:cystathionine beta-lyase